MSSLRPPTLEDVPHAARLVNEHSRDPVDEERLRSRSRLLLHSLHALRERGFARAGLGVDSTSPTGAHTLYESVGMWATHRFDMYERTVA